MIELDKFAENMRALREAKGIRQYELAEKVGVTSTTISAYEKKVKYPSLENALMISKALGTDLNIMCGNCAIIPILDKLNGDSKAFLEYIGKWITLWNLQKSGTISRGLYESLVESGWRLK